MAPWPEPQGDEPKAPDKAAGGADDGAAARDDGAAARDEPDAPPPPSDEPQDLDTSDNVSNLNDGDLKKLLDEAITYKSPRDRLGKSDIFNELLKKAETAEEEGGHDNSLLFPDGRFAPPKRRSGRREKGISVSERQSSYRSLQNINQCHQGDPASLTGRRHGPHQFRRGASTSSTCSSATSESVSTRQREGGSLPCSVNEVQLINFTQGAYNGDSSTRASLEDLRWGSNSSMHKLLGQEPSSRSSPKPATSPLGTEMTTFESRAMINVDRCLDVELGDNGAIAKDAEKKEPRAKMAMSQQLQQETQIIREKAKLLAKQENERDAAPSYRSVMNEDAGLKEPEEVDKPPSFFRLYPSNNICFKSEKFDLSDTVAVKSLIEGPQTQQSCKPQRPISTNVTPATKLYSVYPPSKVDENENMQGSHSESGNAALKKKKKKLGQEFSIKSENVEGYVGDKDLDYLIKYIGEEQKIKGSKFFNDMKNKMTKDLKHVETTAGRRSQRYSEDGKKDQQKGAKVGRKVSGQTGRSKMKRANSLEEVSKSKLEDLTIQPYCRSIGGEDRTSEASKDLDDDEEYNRMLDEQNGNASVKSEDFQGNLTGSDFPDLYCETNPIPNEDSLEFQMVTNSKKQRRKKQKVRQDDRTGRHSYIRGGGMDYEEENYNHHHHHYPHHPPGRRKLKSTCSVPPSDQSGGDSSDCDSVHSLPVSHVATTGSDSATKSYAAIARNPPAPPPPAPIEPPKDEWPAAEKLEADTASSSVSSEPTTPPEEVAPVNVLQDYYPSIAESVKGRKSAQPTPAPPEELPRLPNGDVSRAQRPTPPPAPVVVAATAAKVAWKPPLPPSTQAPPPPKRVTQLNQPPVIFDEKTQCSDSVEGLTFGFSVNPSLMDEVVVESDEALPLTQPPHVPPLPSPQQQQLPPPPSQPSSQVVVAATPPTVAAADAVVPAPAGESDLPTCKKTKDFAAMFRPPPQTPENVNQVEIINFVGTNWGSVLHELKNKDSPSSRAIQYYCGEC